MYNLFFYLIKLNMCNILLSFIYGFLHRLYVWIHVGCTCSVWFTGSTREWVKNLNKSIWGYVTELTVSNKVFIDCIYIYRCGAQNCIIPGKILCDWYYSVDLVNLLCILWLCSIILPSLIGQIFEIAMNTLQISNNFTFYAWQLLTSVIE